jgi:hypothetical protein
VLRLLRAASARFAALGEAQPQAVGARNGFAAGGAVAVFAAGQPPSPAGGRLGRGSRLLQWQQAPLLHPSPRFLAARSLHRRAVVFVFKVLHTFNRVLFRAGKQRRGLAKLRPRLQSAPREILQKSLLRRIGQSRPAQAAAKPWPPRRAQWDSQRRDHANRLGRRRQHARLQRRMLGVRALRRLLPRRIRRQVAVGLRHQRPQAFSASEKFSSSKAGPNAAIAFSAFSRSAASAGVSAPASGTRRQSTCAPCSPRGSPGCRSRWPRSPL